MAGEGGESSSEQAGRSPGPQLNWCESKKSEEKDWAGGFPLGESSTIIPIIEARQRLEGRLEAC